jgi:hypothetical protein
MTTGALPRPPARAAAGGARRPQVSLGDLIRAAGELRADPAAVAAIAALLGLGGAPAASTAAPPAPPSPPPAPPPPAAVPAGAPAGEGGRVRPAGADPRPPRQPLVVRTAAPRTGPPQPLHGTVEQLLPAPPPPGRRPAEPLLPPAHQRAVLSALVAVARPGREVDVATLVDRVASRQPVRSVPRLPASTTRLGVQLLLDQGPSMGPWLRDLRLLAGALRQVAGADAVQVLATDGDLTAVQPLSEDAGPRAYTPPGGGRPVLVASDLGIGGAGGVPPGRWLELARLTREAGCPLAVLVPYPPARWPAWARRRLTLVQWDRPTDAGQARRAARHAAARAGIRP